MIPARPSGSDQGQRNTALLQKAPTAFLLKGWMALYPLESQKTLMQLEGPEVAVMAKHLRQPQL